MATESSLTGHPPSERLGAFALGVLISDLVLAPILWWFTGEVPSIVFVSAPLALAALIVAFLWFHHERLGSE